MFFRSILYGFILLYPNIIPQIAAAWSFKEAAMWSKDYPECGGNNQSPVDLNHDDLYLGLQHPWLRFTGTKTVPTNATLLNDGRKLEIMYNWPGSPPMIYGGPLSGKYRLEKLAIRWPSSHTYENQSFPLAIHMVYYNEKYEMYDEALEKEDGIVAKEIVFKIGAESKGLNLILKNTENVLATPNATAEIEPFELETFQPVKLNAIYFVYNGSMMRPPCHESVTWIISSSIFLASQEQVDKFKSTKLIEGDDANARPIQPINGRRIEIVRGDL